MPPAAASLPGRLSFYLGSFPSMPDLEFTLHFTPDEVLRYYRGQARSVVATLDDGRTLQFPASALQKVVTENGVHGRFRLRFDANHKFLGLERV